MQRIVMTERELNKSFLQYVHFFSRVLFFIHFYRKFIQSIV